MYTDEIIQLMVCICAHAQKKKIKQKKIIINLFILVSETRISF